MPLAIGDRHCELNEFLYFNGISEAQLQTGRGISRMVQLEVSLF